MAKTLRANIKTFLQDEEDRFMKMECNGYKKHLLRKEQLKMGILPRKDMKRELKTTEPTFMTDERIHDDLKLDFPDLDFSADQELYKNINQDFLTLDKAEW